MRHYATAEVAEDPEIGPAALLALADLAELTELRSFRRLRILAPLVQEAHDRFEAAQRLTAALRALP